MSFTTGKLVMTKGIHERILSDNAFAEGICKSVERYLKCDWGDLCQEDKDENENALKQGERIFALYKIMDEKVYIITEADRSVTTILFAREY